MQVSHGAALGAFTGVSLGMALNGLFRGGGLIIVLIGAALVSAGVILYLHATFRGMGNNSKITPLRTHIAAAIFCALTATIATWYSSLAVGNA